MVTKEGKNENNEINLKDNNNNNNNKEKRNLRVRHLSMGDISLYKKVLPWR